MENVDAEISMEIGALMFSMEFHGKCPNPPCKYFPWKSMEKFPWNSMEIDVLILHGIPWNSMEVFHTGCNYKFSETLAILLFSGTNPSTPVSLTCPILYSAPKMFA